MHGVTGALVLYAVEKKIVKEFVCTQMGHIATIYLSWSSFSPAWNIIYFQFPPFPYDIIVVSTIRTISLIFVGVHTCIFS